MLEIQITNTPDYTTMTEKTGLIVLCDDDFDEKEIFQLALNKSDSDLRLLFFGNCSDLLDYLLDPHAEKPMLVFLDIDIPQTSGLTTLEIIRIRYSKEDLPVVMYTLNTNPALIDRSRELGANYYLIKPNEIKSLFTAINDIVRKVKNNAVAGTEEFII